MKGSLIKCFSNNTEWSWELPQFHIAVRDFLLRKFSRKWIDRGGLITYLNPALHHKISSPDRHLLHTLQHCPLLFGKFPEENESFQPQLLPPFSQTCETNISIWVGLLTVPSSKSLNSKTKVTKIWSYHLQKYVSSFNVNKCPTRCNYTQLYFICKLLYIFRVVSPPIISSINNCFYSIWYWSTVAALADELRLSLNSSAIATVPDAVDIIACAPDDGWRGHPKHVEQFTDKIKLCIVASCWTFIDIDLRCTVPWT